jgi:ATPase subunit of ABC transporter with duplicated ATPase domains
VISTVKIAYVDQAHSNNLINLFGKNFCDGQELIMMEGVRVNSCVFKFSTLEEVIKTKVSTLSGGNNRFTPAMTLKEEGNMCFSMSLPMI